MKKFFITSGALLFAVLSVISCNSNGNKGNKGGPKQLPVPQNVKVEVPTKFNTLKVSWDNVDNNEGYVVSYKGGEQSQPETKEVDRNALDFELTGLKGGVEYVITVKAKGDSKKFLDSPESEGMKATPKGKQNAKELPVPANFKAEATGAKGEVRVFWDTVIDEKTKQPIADKYVISYKRTDAQGERQKVEVMGRQITKFFSNLTDNVEYSFWIMSKARDDDEHWKDSPESAEVKATPKYEVRLYVRGIYIKDDFDGMKTEDVLKGIIGTTTHSVKPNEQQKDELSMDVVKHAGKRLLFSIGFANRREDIKSVKFNNEAPSMLAMKLVDLDAHDFYYKAYNYVNDKVEVNVEVELSDGKTAKKKYTFTQKALSLNTNIKAIVVDGKDYTPVALPGQQTLKIYLPSEFEGTKHKISAKLEDPKAKYQLTIPVQAGAETDWKVVPPETEVKLGKDEEVWFAFNVIPEAGEFYTWKDAQIFLQFGRGEPPSIDELQELKVGEVNIKTAKTKETAVKVTAKDLVENCSCTPGAKYCEGTIGNQYIMIFSRESYDKLKTLPQKKVLGEMDEDDFTIDTDKDLKDTPSEFIFMINEVDMDKGKCRDGFYSVWLKK